MHRQLFLLLLGVMLFAGVSCRSTKASRIPEVGRFSGSIAEFNETFSGDLLDMEVVPGDRIECYFVSTDRYPEAVPHGPYRILYDDESSDIAYEGLFYFGERFCVGIDYWGKGGLEAVESVGTSSWRGDIQFNAFGEAVRWDVSDGESDRRIRVKYSTFADPEAHVGVIELIVSEPDQTWIYFDDDGEIRKWSISGEDGDVQFEIVRRNRTNQYDVMEFRNGRAWSGVETINGVHFSYEKGEVVEQKQRVPVDAALGE